MRLSAGREAHLPPQTQHQLLKVKMNEGFRIRAVHLDAVSPVLSVESVHLA